MKVTYRGCGFRALAATAAVLAALTVVASAVTPEEVLQDPKLEARARAISQNLRCVVCQNQSIDDSNAPLAHDLRVLLRERLVSGETDEQAVDYIVARYGNFVLLKPPMHWNTLFLWVAPAFFVIIAAIGFGGHLRRRTTDQTAGSEAPLTATELERIDELLSKWSST
jgi:cytochrome c-type biogenesis protein CcmH